MKPGEGAGYFLADLADGISDEEMRRRYADGKYGNLRKDWVTEWRRLANRK